MTRERAIHFVFAAVLCTAALIAPRVAAQPIAEQPVAQQPVAEGDERPRDEARTFVAGNLSETAIVAALLGAHPSSYRMVGTSSLTLQVDLGGPIDAAFKPETATHPRGWLAEVAAFRVGRELGLDGVPPAVLRAIDRAQLRRNLETGGGYVADQPLPNELVVTGGSIRGAFIYWVPGMLRSDIDSPEGIARWSAWLALGGEIPERERMIARDLADVLVFDYLIGNRDRWSGGNVRPVEEGRIVIRDHNLAFPHALGAGVQQRMVDSLTRTQRFSRRTIERLVAMDEEALRAAVADHDEASLLDDRQLAAVMDRRATILSYVGALIEQHGEDPVLFFP